MRPGTKTGSSDSGQNYEDQVKPDLLDFLFTLALTIGIAPELIGAEGLLSKNWALVLPDLAFATNFFTFILGVSTLLFSWYGFNASISNNPVLYGSLAGLFRFALDAFLVVLYGFLLIMYEKLGIVTALLVLIFALYTIWDLLKLAEYRKEPFDGNGILNRGFCVLLIRNLFIRKSLAYFLLLVPVFIFETSLIYESNVLMKDSVVILILFIITFVYRWDKVEWNFRGKEETIARVEDTDQVNHPKKAS